MQAVQIINPDQNGLYLVTAEELADHLGTTVPYLLDRAKEESK
ncbi:hypothetical protein [Lacticaseibacillus saniviri]|nr:hypothetical protein [Lacticaseibacillus saniviri]